jgi:hypothetical protein
MEPLPVAVAEVAEVGEEEDLLLNRVHPMLLVAVAVAAQDLMQVRVVVVVKVNPEPHQQVRAGNPVLMAQVLLVEQGGKVA